MNKRETRIAICYYGLPRSIRTVYTNHANNIFAPLRDSSIRHSVYVHLWNIQGKQLVWNNEIDQEPDYEAINLVQPIELRRESQEDWFNTINFSEFFYQHDYDQFKYDKHKGEWVRQLVKNHICALESQRRVTMLINSTPDFVMYLRPDYEFEQVIDLSFLQNLKIDQIALPDYRHFEGYNDTFSVMRWETACSFSERIKGLPEFRKTEGRIVSEKYLKYYLESNNIQPIFQPIKYNIVRPDGSREFKNTRVTFPIPRSI